MSAVQRAPKSARMQGTEVSAKGSLARAEFLRLVSRRLVRLLVLIGLFGVLAGAFLVFIRTGNASPADIASAKLQAEQQYQFCASNVQSAPAPVSPSTNPDGSPSPGPNPQTLTAAQIAQLCSTSYENYLRSTPFHAATGVGGGALAVLGGFAVLFLIIGATAGGAEWSAKTMPALLTWEPRRMRVLTTKVLVLDAVTLVLAAGAAAVWFVLALLIAHFHGDWSGRPSNFWSLLAAQEGKGLLLAAVTATTGFALASLMRSTGAVLGVAFAYLVLVENAVRIFAPKLSPWIIGNNVAALLLPHGYDAQISRDGRPVFGVPPQLWYHISGFQGGALLTAVAVTLFAAALFLFHRRDLT